MEAWEITWTERYGLGFKYFNNMNKENTSQSRDWFIV
jgi:hypothetical protein